MAAQHCQFEIYTHAAGKYRWRLRAKNGEIIASGESYISKAGCESGIEAVRTCAKDAIIEDKT